MKVKSMIKMYNMIRRPFSFVFAFIITFVIVSCQIMPCFVFAEAIPVGQPVSTGSLWTVIEGSGPEENLVKDPFLFSVEMANGFGLGLLAKQHFWDETNAEIAQKISDGTLTNSDIGTVIYKEVDGVQVPVGIKNTIYGQNMYYLTDDLANKILEENLQDDIAIQNAITDYWERVIISDIEPFQQSVALADNWICTFKDQSQDILSVIADAFYNLFGVSNEEPEANFFGTGSWIKYKINQYATSFTERKIDTSVISNYARDSFVILTWDAVYSVNNRPCLVYALYAHANATTDPMIYTKLDAIFFYTDVYHVIEPVNIPIKKISPDAVGSDGVGTPDTVDFTNIFEEWPLIVHLPSVRPSINNGIRYNVGAIIGSVNDIASAVDSVVDANSDASGNPEFTPDTRPEISPAEFPELLPSPYEVPWSISFPSEFPDPDTWIDPESNPFPDPVPDPGDDPGGDDPGGDDPGGDDPGGDDNDWDDEPPQRPRLRVPVLLTLFPFCIPFDIKRSIEWFGVGSDEEINGHNESISANYITGVYNDMSASEVEEINGNGMEPVFAIPLNLGVAGQQVLNTVVVLDLTEYGIPVLVQYLKTVQIIAWIIVLGVATYKFIY